MFSESTGAYLVTERVSIRNAGGELLTVADAGPWLLVKLPPGRYTVAAAYGGRAHSFGRDYIIPAPFDPRLMEVVA